VTPSLEKLAAAFPVAAHPREPIWHPAFFSLQALERENEGWPDETLVSYLGKKDVAVQPGNIDPAQSVVIGDLGPDRLIALDYRTSKERPSVVYLVGNEEPRWVQAAPDIETLLRMLDL
jgi:hypothetical protein